MRTGHSGPFTILGLVDERCGGVYDNIGDVIPKAKRNEIMARYKQAAGFAMEALNGAAPTIAVGVGSGGADVLAGRCMLDEMLAEYRYSDTLSSTTKKDKFQTEI